MAIRTVHRLRAVIILLATVVGGGTLGFVLIEGWNPLDAFYMTVITISTVGYSEVKPLSETGRAFAIFLIIVGVGATLTGMTIFFEMLVEGQIRGLMGKRRMERGLRRMKDHYIVCGYGRVGKRVVDELLRRGKKVVVIEDDPDRQEELSDANIPFVPGDASDDKVLQNAEISRAEGLIVAIPSQANNVLIVLTARQLNPELRIVGRGDEDSAKQKILRAGADAVVCPHEAGGIRMAIAGVSPNVLDFMQIAGGDETEIRIDEIRVGEGSKLCGSTLKDSPIRSQLGLIVIGIRKAGGRMRFNPDATERLDAGDIIIVIGANDKLGTLRELTVSPAGTPAEAP
ncbi:MAG: potassium channel protein [Candidatus Zixiibacteriota bacterium]